MRVLIVNTNTMKPPIAPIGLDYINGPLRRKGYNTSLLDLCFSDNCELDISESVKRYSPDVVAVTIRNTDDCYLASAEFFLPQIEGYIDAIRTHTDAPLVLGGPGLSVVPKGCLAYTDCKYAISGDGEESIVEFCEYVENKGDCESVSNLVWQDEYGNYVENQRRYADLSADGIAERELVDNRKYFELGGQAGFETHRGCQMHCSFCADVVAKGNKERFRRPQDVAGELVSLLDVGIDCFHTCDCEFNLPQEYAKEVCKAIIASGIANKVQWYAYCSIVPFTDDLAKLMRRAGCVGINFSAVHTDNSILKSYDCVFTKEDLFSTAKLCRDNDIVFMYDMLLGGPGETQNTIETCISDIKSMDCDCVGLSTGLRVYDNTPVAAKLKADGGVEGNPGIIGETSDNPHLLSPVFYVEPAIAERFNDIVRGCVAGDKRFFLPENDDKEGNYNYNDNDLLVSAIANGRRGAYWDILRQIK